MSGYGSILLALVVAGFAGGFAIGRNVGGLRLLAALALWLPVPFVIIAAVLGTSIDPTLSRDRASYDFQMAFVLVSMAAAIPWGMANLAGALIGRRRRKRLDRPPVTPGASPPNDADLPDWSRADNPLLDLDQLGARMREIAARAGLGENLLPGLGAPTSGEGDFLYRDKFEYIYVWLERGHPSSEERSANADQILYCVFRDKTFGVATRRMSEQGPTGADYTTRLAVERERVLAEIDPRWGRRFALDRAAASARR